MAVVEENLWFKEVPPPISSRVNFISGEVIKDVPRSFKEVLSNEGNVKCPFLNLVHTMHNGCPALYISDEDLDKLAVPFNFALIGKFLLGRPTMDRVRSFFKALNLEGSFKVGILDARHVLIILDNANDYSRIFSQRSWYVYNCNMRILKWTKDFVINEEPSITLVWISFPVSNSYLISPQVLFSLGKFFGNPLKIDKATADLSRPNLARVLVEMDVLKDHPNFLYLGNGNHTYTQEVIFENVPIFCSNCRIFGHDVGSCFKLHPVKEKSKVEDVKVGDNFVSNVVHHGFHFKKDNKEIWKVKNKGNLVDVVDDKVNEVVHFNKEDSFIPDNNEASVSNGNCDGDEKVEDVVFCGELRKDSLGVHGDSFIPVIKDPYLSIGDQDDAKDDGGICCQKVVVLVLHVDQDGRMDGVLGCGCLDGGNFVGDRIEGFHDDIHDDIRRVCSHGDGRMEGFHDDSRLEGSHIVDKVVGVDEDVVSARLFHSDDGLGRSPFVETTYLGKEFLRRSSSTSNVGAVVDKSSFQHMKDNDEDYSLDSDDNDSFHEDDGDDEDFMGMGNLVANPLYLCTPCDRSSFYSTNGSDSRYSQEIHVRVGKGFNMSSRFSPRITRSRTRRKFV